MYGVGSRFLVLNPRVARLGAMVAFVLASLLGPSTAQATSPSASASTKGALHGSAMAVTSGWHELPPPPERWSGVMAFDNATENMVLYGGAGGGAYLGDTWTWNGVNWTEALPVTSPGPVVNAGMAYDDAAGVMLLFGGVIGDSTSWPPNGAWTWDGTTWTQLNSSSAPMSRTLPNLAYDAALGKVVLFGGCCDDTGRALNDTWTWDGTTWTQVFPAVFPAGQAWAQAMTYDAATQTVVFVEVAPYGSPAPTETWTFDGTTWTQQNPATSVTIPPGDGQMMMAYDAATQTVVLYGSQTGQTWTWNGTNWTLQNPTTQPGPLDNAQFTYDPTTQSVIMFGGINGVAMDSTWSWDGTNWSVVDPVPDARTGAAMTYQATNGTTLLFGGLDHAGKAQSDTWTWNGTAWSQVRPVTTPRARYGASLTFDSLHRSAVLFGGATCLTANCSTAWDLADTWTWDGTNWTRKAGTSAPPARQWASFAYDPLIQRAILFGGLNASGQPLGDTWVWSGATWIKLQPAVSPSPRWGAALAYDPATRSLVLFGGCADAQCQSVLSDTWTWNGRAWIQQAASSPPGRYQASMAYGRSTAAVVLFGGYDATKIPLNDTWAWNGSAWSLLTSSNSPPPRAAASMVYDSAIGAAVLFGGSSPTTSTASSGFQGDVWSLR